MPGNCSCRLINSQFRVASFRCFSNPDATPDSLVSENWKSGQLTSGHTAHHCGQHTTAVGTEQHVKRVPVVGGDVLEGEGPGEQQLVAVLVSTA